MCLEKREHIMSSIKEIFVKYGYEIVYFFHALFCKVFSFFPIDKKKIHVSCWTGRGGFSCNPKYIISELNKQFPGKYKIYWAVNNPENEVKRFPSCIHLVKYHSLHSLYHQMTAFLWIDNCRKDMPIKRKGQYYLQTWHGSGPMKKIEADTRDALVMGYEYNARKDSKMIDWILSGCSIETKIYRNSFWYNGQILEYGSPRADALFHSRKDELKKVFCIDNNLPFSTNLILYAPTFRDKKKGTEFDYGMNVDSVLASCQKRFGGEWIMLLRLHKNNMISADSIKRNKRCIDVTVYPDMQELLEFVDVAIDDYSSWFYDFMYTRRPCFIYAPDINEYDDIRGFYIDFRSLPFPISDSIDSLCKDIESFDEADRDKKYNQFFSYIGSFNDGHASERVVKMISDIK